MPPPCAGKTLSILLALFTPIATASIILPIPVGGNTAAIAADDQLESTHGDYSLEVVDPVSPNPNEVLPQQLELRRKGKVVSSHEVSGFLLAIHWSPNDRWVATDVRDGNSGDYLWVLDLSNGKVVKRSEEYLQGPIEKAAFAEFKKLDPRVDEETMLHHWLRAVAWKDGDTLSVSLKADYVGEIGWFRYVSDMKVTPEGLKAGPFQVTRGPYKD